MKNSVVFIGLFILFSFELSAQCLSSNDLVIRTAKSCSYFDNGVLIIRNLKAKTPYSVLVNERTYSYTANDSGTLSVYSLAPGIYDGIRISDRINNCPEIIIEDSVVIDSWKNELRGPVTACQGETLRLTTTATSTWTINSAIINFNATETNLQITDNTDVTIVAKALIEGCYERDTLQIQVHAVPDIGLKFPDKTYCYNKQNERVELALSHGMISEMTYNGEQIESSGSSIFQLNLGNETDENILRVTAENDSKCQVTSDIVLPFAGEAPNDDVEIIWWPGNIFSIKHDNPQLAYKWGWLNATGEKRYAAPHAVSSDGKHYFAGNQSAEVLDLMERGEDSAYLLFVEYNIIGEACSNTLLLNQSNMPIFRSQGEHLQSGLQLKAFPNPFVENIIVSSSKMSGFSQLDLSIHDTSGKLFYQYAVEITNGFLIDLSTAEFPKGIYFIQLSNNGYTLLSQKVIKQ